MESVDTHLAQSYVYHVGIEPYGPPWLTLSTFERKVRGLRPWPLNYTNCLFVLIKEASLGIEPRTKSLSPPKCHLVLGSILEDASFIGTNK